jgi:hypothetical protein
VASFFPFQATYYLIGLSFIEQELNRNKIGFRKNDHALLAVDDVAALQATADLAGLRSAGGLPSRSTTPSRPLSNSPPRATV